MENGKESVESSQNLTLLRHVFRCPWDMARSLMKPCSTLDLLHPIITGR